MSKETTERGNRKRQAIRDVIYSVLMDCIRDHKLLEETKKTVFKHIGVIKGKTKPQELSLVTSVIGEMQLENPEWVKKLIKDKGWKVGV